MSALAAVAAAASAVLLVAGVGRLTVNGAAPRRARRPGPLARTTRGAALGARLARAGVPLTPDRFALLVTVAAGAAAALGAIVVRTPLAAAAGAAVALGAATALLRSADRRHLARVEAQLPGVAQQLAAGLGAGLSLRQALARAARDAPEPARDELAQVARELDLGGRVETALQAASERLPARDLRILVTAILVQRRTGGNLARALAAIAERLEERGRLARELRGATAQARMTAWLVAALPLGGGAVAELASPGTLERVLTRGAGPALVGVSACLYGLGVLLIRRIGRVEP